MSVVCESNINCSCNKAEHECKRVVITGGPGAGKTAILEIARKNFCQHVSILPESATILFGGGFWRHDTVTGKMAAQRAIFHIQKEMENLVEGEATSAIALCDRGTLDGLAYWPGKSEDFFREVNSTLDNELQRYAAVIHLRSPALSQGYDHSNPVRIESASEAAHIDERIFNVWSKHPNRIVIESSQDFLEKMAIAIRAIKDQLPECCRGHKIRELGE